MSIQKQVKAMRSKLDPAKLELTRLKFRKRRRQYENNTGTFTFNIDSLESYSYRWWQLGGYFPHHGYVVNNFYYSKSTRMHQNRIYDLLFKANIPFKTISAPKGLNNLSASIKFLLNSAKYLRQNSPNRTKLARSKKAYKIRQKALVENLLSLRQLKQSKE